MLPDAGLLIHCFDSVEDQATLTLNPKPETLTLTLTLNHSPHTNTQAEKWRPGLATGKNHDNPSGSIIFRDQSLTPDGEPYAHRTDPRPQNTATPIHPYLARVQQPLHPRPPDGISY